MKVSFQWTFEDSQRWAATDRVRQTVPGARCCDGEGEVAHWCTSRRRHDQICRWRRAQATLWFRTRDRADGVLQIARYRPLNALVNNSVDMQNIRSVGLLRAFLLPWSRSSWSYDLNTQTLHRQYWRRTHFHVQNAFLDQITARRRHTDRQMWQRVIPRR